MNLTDLQHALQRRHIDAWLIYDFRGSNSVLPLLLPAPPAHKRTTTRRTFYFIPSRGQPTLLVHSLDANQFEAGSLPPGVERRIFLSWRDLRAELERLLLGRSRVAMEYSPGGSLPVVSMVDAGTIELIRSMGVDVVSSADVMQDAVAVWSADAVKTHLEVSKQTVEIARGAFAFIGERLQSRQTVNEHHVQQWILQRFASLGLETPDGPIVAANAHAGDPHFEVSAQNPAPIVPGDWVLIDLWARRPGDSNIFSDITWTGYVRRASHDRPSDRHRLVYDTVAAARDAAVRLAQESWRAGLPVQGWQLDDAARGVLTRADSGRLAQFIRHRTGHSLSPGPRVHGVGMNLDNFETHDTRSMTPGIGFTVEPGLYLPEFGVRSEVNVYVDPGIGPIVTGETQQEIVLI
ncbi:MAG: M24 family metallopeptidase [Phycisphaerales bacterium]